MSARRDQELPLCLTKTAQPGFKVEELKFERAVLEGLYPMGGTPFWSTETA